MNRHICKKMPQDAELHEDYIESKIWWYNKRLRNDKDVAMGGTRVYYCAWCGIELINGNKTTD